MRDTVDNKKVVLVFGLREKIMKDRRERKMEERKIGKKMVQTIQVDEGPEEEIEEVYKLGHFEGGARPLKIKFMSQNVANEILRTWKLGKTKEYKKYLSKRI